MGASPTTDTKFRRIFDDHFDAVTRYCLRRLPVADVNDATAEVFLVAWKKDDRVPSGAEALPWLYGVARNVVRNASRSSRRSERLAGRLGGLARHHTPDLGAVVVRRQEDKELLDALSGLNPNDQEVLRLKAYEGRDAARVINYQEWVRSNRPELESQLFNFFGSLRIQPDSIEAHRDAIADWKAQGG